MHDAARGLRPRDGRRRFLSTDHLAADAVVAYVDGVLGRGAMMRAASHLGECPMCAAEVESQRQARESLRTSGPVTAPESLRSILNAIAADGCRRRPGPDGRG